MAQERTTISFRRIGESTWHDMPIPYSVGYSQNKIWSENAGRGTSTGASVGDIVTIKRKLVIKWQYRSGAEIALLNSWVSNRNIPFFQVRVLDETFNWVAFTCYAGDTNAEAYSWNSEFQLVKTFDVDLIEQ